MKTFLACSQIFITSLCVAQTSQADTIQQAIAPSNQTILSMGTGGNVEAENGLVTVGVVTAVIGTLVFSSGHRAKKSETANIVSWSGRVNYTPFRAHLKMFLGGTLALFGGGVAILTKPIANAKERQLTRQIERYQKQSENLGRNE